ncbi:MAG: DUF6642 family protein [Ginsengibacter sp.]|jgi:hypothetical protein
MRIKPKGVFCLEGFWYGDHRDLISVTPVLELVGKHSRMPFLHHRCNTKAEFEYSINRWKTKAFCKKYPILYLGFHGEPGFIKVGKDVITLTDLSRILGDTCLQSIIHFGSCSTLNINRSRVQNFMNKTGVLAVMGYRRDVDWLPSASFEILLLDILQTNPFDSDGIKLFSKMIKKECKRQVKELDFRLMINGKNGEVRIPKRVNGSK